MQPSNTAPRFCPKCGTQAVQGAAFCAKCGTFLDTLPPTPPPTATPPAPPSPTARVPTPAAKPRTSTRLRNVLIVGGLLILALIFVPRIQGDGSSLSGPTPVPPDKAAAAYLDPRELAADPKAYVGRNIFLQGSSNNVDQKSDYTWVQIMAQVRDKDYVTESIIVEMHPKATTLLKSECYRMYGVVQGTQKVKLVLTGAEKDAPVIRGYAFEAAPTSGSSSICAKP